MRLIFERICSRCCDSVFQHRLTGVVVVSAEANNHLIVENTEDSRFRVHVFPLW